MTKYLDLDMMNKSYAGSTQYGECSLIGNDGERLPNQ